jgi:ABC-type Fe3+ transport system, permease component
LKPRELVRASLILFLVFPFLFLLTQFRLQEWPEWAEVFWAFKNSFYQAFLSAVFSLVIGAVAALGLISYKAHAKKPVRVLLEVLCLVPNFLPPIFILLAVLNVIEPFPMGVLGIAIVHTVINYGLVAVLIAGLIEAKFGRYIEVAFIEGSTRWQFYREVLFPLLKKDLLLIGLFVFVVCFGSFSIPLIVGGARGTTVEVLIYEKIRLSSDWGGAVLLAFLQSIFIFAISFIAQKGKSSPATSIANMDLIKWPAGVVVIGLISLLYIGGYAEGLFEGIQFISSFYEIQSALWWNFFGSLTIGITVGLLCYGGLLLIAYSFPKKWFEQFLNGYVAPSTSLACFCLLLIGPNGGVWTFIKIPLALTLLSLNSLYRMGWDGSLESLRSQISVARTLGASPELIFKEILFPQITKRAGLLAGIASIWACGDFAVSRILAHRDISIAMMTETLMSGYRLNQAILLSSLIIVAALICFVFIIGVSRVLGRKSLS